MTREFLKSKLSRMSCLYEYQKKLEEEKELLRAQKDQIREEEKVRRELDAAKKKIEKDEMQFNNEINRMMKYLQSTSLEAEKNYIWIKLKSWKKDLLSYVKKRKLFYNGNQMLKRDLSTLSLISVLLGKMFIKSA